MEVVGDTAGSPVTVYMEVVGDTAGSPVYSVYRGGGRYCRKSSGPCI